MEYRNKRTGSVISSEAECNGEDWEKLSPSPAICEEKKEPVKKTVKRTAKEKK